MKVNEHFAHNSTREGLKIWWYAGLDVVVAPGLNNSTENEKSQQQNYYDLCHHK
jgi:hypothetical protein